MIFLVNFVASKFESKVNLHFFKIGRCFILYFKAIFLFIGRQFFIRFDFSLATLFDLIDFLRAIILPVNLFVIFNTFLGFRFSNFWLIPLRSTNAKYFAKFSMSFTVFQLTECLVCLFQYLLFPITI